MLTHTLVKHAMVITVISLLTVSSAYAADKTALCEQSIAGINFSQSTEEMRAVLSNRFAFKWKSQKAEFSLKTYAKRTHPGDRDSSIIYMKAFDQSRSRITTEHYIKVPKDNHAAWMSLDWDYGKYVQEKTQRLCTPEVTNLRPRAVPPRIAGKQNVACKSGIAGTSLSVHQSAPDVSKSLYQCKYSLTYGGVSQIEGGDGTHELLVFQETLAYNLNGRP